MVESALLAAHCSNEELKKVSQSPRGTTISCMIEVGSYTDIYSSFPETVYRESLVSSLPTPSTVERGVTTVTYSILHRLASS